MAFWRQFILSKNEREIKRISAMLGAINAFEPAMNKLSDAALQGKTAILRERFEQAYTALGGDISKRMFEGNQQARVAERKRLATALATLLPEAFAVVREASKRVLHLRHYDVQMIGGIVLHEGNIAEMKTGEGKTLVATLPAYLNALTYFGVHVVTVNEYLASRDAAWMGRLYHFLGMDVGVIMHGLNDQQRRAAYQAPITYGTNSEFGFDYLRDNMKFFLHDYVQRGMHYAIVDEVDSILIDEARTPLIISGPAEESTDKYHRLNAIIPMLRSEQDYVIDEKARTVLLTEEGIHTVEKLLKIDNLYDPDHIEILHHMNQALRAHTLYRRDVDYIVEAGKVKIIDEFTGRVLDGRRWSDGLHQAVEAKEGVRIENENQTLATITYQNYFRNFIKLSGMTGTAETEAEEFAKIYDLDVVVVPTNQPMVRQDADDVVYKSESEKFAAIVEEIKVRTARGQPILVGTISVEKSEILSRYLKKLSIPHNVLNAKFHQQEAFVVAQAGRRGAVTIATNMAGRGTDILLGGNPEFLAQAENPTPEQYNAVLERFIAQCQAEKQLVLQAGGLHILGTERHESRRIDNQLRGRAGRQGDPGSSRFYISLEDDLMRIFGGERIVEVMERFGMKEGEVIEHPWVNKSIENAQRRVEGHNFDVRKHLLEYDDVMNDQRGAVYKLRRLVLGADTDNTREMILDLLEDVILGLVLRACPDKSHMQEWDITGLEHMCKEQFDFDIAFAEVGYDDKESLQVKLFEHLEHVLQERENLYTKDAFYHVCRIIYLQTIDHLWKEHLREMDQLREGISLRSYAQKDPKQEYKKEGYNLFANMMASIAFDVLQKVYRVVINSDTEETYQERLQMMRSKQQQLLQTEPVPKTISKATSQPTPHKSDEPKQIPLRVALKVGRNDPCHCGSGKKYKKCCMEKDALQTP